MKRAAYILSIVWLVIGAIPFILSNAGLWRCRVGCTNNGGGDERKLDFQDSDASFWPLPTGAFLFELVTTILVSWFVIKKDQPVKVIQMVHFLVVPPVVVGALFADGVKISIESYRLGTLSTLFCPISGCQVLCNVDSFACDCGINIGECTLTPMRVVIFFFVVLRIISMVLSIMFWTDASNGKVSSKFGG